MIPKRTIEYDSLFFDGKKMVKTNYILLIVSRQILYIAFLAITLFYLVLLHFKKIEFYGKILNIYIIIY